MFFCNAKRLRIAEFDKPVPGDNHINQNLRNRFAPVLPIREREGVKFSESLYDYTKAVKI
jgi:hypothetical protein